MQDMDTVQLFKSSGTNQAERFVALLSEKSFLGLWSYPNVFRDQRAGGSKESDGKELCDLLVICGDDLILFSIKACRLKNSGDLDRDWCRWYKRAIKKSADQVYGAERWIKQNPDRVFVDRRCTRRLPVSLTSAAKGRIHRVVVALGISDACRAHLGGSGSLTLDPTVVGNQHLDPNHENFHTFHVGRVHSSKGYVHVLDEISLQVIMRELDTVKDFVWYLSTKEDFIDQERLLIAAGEENLLAYYLSHMDRSIHRHTIPLEDGYDKIVVEDGHWLKHIQSREYAAKREADEISYAWDEIINDFVRHTIDGTLRESSVVGLSGSERALRAMASVPRMTRRLLSKSIYDFLIQSVNEEIACRRIELQGSDTLYVIVLMRENNDLRIGYRDFRQKYLSSYCLVAGYRNKGYKEIVGISTELPIESSGRSYDLVLMQNDLWTDEDETQAKDLLEASNWLQNVRRTEMEDFEYPPAEGSHASSERVA